MDVLYLDTMRIIRSLYLNLFFSLFLPLCSFRYEETVTIERDCLLYKLGYFALTVIVLGLTSSAFGSVMVRTPLSKSACAFSDTTSVGRETERSNEPQRCSWICQDFSFCSSIVLHLTSDRQYLTGDIDLYIIGFEAREGSLDDNIIIGLVHVNRRRRPSRHLGERAGV